MNNCPICNTKLEHFEDYMDWILMESDDTCKDGCKRYSHHFITGNYEIGIANDCGKWKTWQWSYNSPKEEQTAIEVEIDAAIVQAKEERDELQL